MKIVNSFWLLTMFAEAWHFRCLTVFWTCIWFMMSFFAFMSISKPLPHSQHVLGQESQSFCKKCPYLEFPWSAFSRIWTEYGDLLCKSLHLLCNLLWKLRFQSECRKIWTSETPNTDTFCAVNTSEKGLHFKCSPVKLRIFSEQLF